jgi:secreted trypsin-like serine protease
MFLRFALLLFGAQSLLVRGVAMAETNETRIVGGVEAPRGKLTFVAGLWTKGGGFPFCGGSLIASR